MLEQRRYERVAFYCGVQLTLLPNGPTIPARSFDVSLGGLGLTAKVFLDCEQSVRVRLRLRNGANGWTEEAIEGRIAHCCADENGNRIGIQFTETIRESTHPALSHKLNTL